MTQPNTREFARFPMWMRHPAQQAAVISDDYAGGERRATDARPGAPLRFPPVMVENEDQEEYHRAQGYEPSAGNPTAFLKATVAPEPPGYQRHEYPRMLPGGMIDQGPDAPKPPDNYYPLWVRMDGYEPTLVQNKEEHEALLAERNVSTETVVSNGVSEVRGVSEAELECRGALAEAALLYAVDLGQEPELKRAIEETEARRHPTAVQRRAAIAAAFTDLDDAEAVAGLFGITVGEVRRIGKKRDSEAAVLERAAALTAEADAEAHFQTALDPIGQMETDGAPAPQPRKPGRPRKPRNPE